MATILPGAACICDCKHAGQRGVNATLPLLRPARPQHHRYNRIRMYRVPRYRLGAKTRHRWSQARASLRPGYAEDP